MSLADLARDRPLVFFDLETTGLSITSDRVIQFAGVRYAAGEEPTELAQFLDPEMPIHPDAEAVHGISSAQLADEPTFAEFAEELLAFIGDADLAGYNLGRFDIPVLMEEFAREGIRFRMDGRRVVDAQRIFYKMEPRTLAGALKFYCGEDLADAHDAMADAKATARVLGGQLERYALATDVDALHELSREPGQLDGTNRLRADAQGHPVFNFGKYRGQRVRDVFKREPSYYHWIQGKDFSVQVKEITREVWEREGR